MPIQECSWCHSMPQRFYSSLSLANDKYLFCTKECFEQWRERNSKKCFCCGQNIFDSAFMVQYGDGRVSCLNCYQHAITTSEQLEHCRRRILRYFFVNYRYVPICGVIPELCDKFVFKNNFKRMSDDTLGVYGWEQNHRTTQCKISILRGLPIDQFEEVMVHELAHDMMYHTWGPTNNHVISEGFAEYMAYRYNEQNDRSMLNQRMLCASRKNPYGENGDPYRDGLLLLLSLDKKNHSYGVVEQFISNFFNNHKR